MSTEWHWYRALAQAHLHNAGGSCDLQQSRHILYATLLLASLSSTAFAMFVGSPDLRRDVDSADVVCVGKAVTMERAADKSAIIGFRVDRVLKGGVAPGSEIRIQYDTRFPQMVTDYSMVLLSRQGDGFRFARKALSSVPASDTAATPYTRSTDAQANVHWEMVNSLRSSSAFVVRAALEQTGVIRSDDIKTHVRPRMSDPDPAIRALAFTTCIGSGDKSVVVPALDFLFEALQDSKQAETFPAATLRIAMEQTVLPHDYLPRLAERMSSKATSVRRTASLLMRMSDDPTAIPILRSALTDSDTQVRYNAVMGLARICKAGSDYQPPFDEFKINESRYIDYWQNRKWN